MQPQTTPQDGFVPKWRQFSPLTRVWVQNPFDHDVIFQVADEYNRPFQYRLPAGKVSELPGGAIATLGVKQLVDQLISSTKGDEMHMHDPLTRKKHEDAIILRIKETNPTVNATAEGEIDLSVKGDDVTDEGDTPPSTEETAFPGLNDAPDVAPLPPVAKEGLKNVVAASLPATNSEESANNAHSGVEG